MRLAVHHEYENNDCFVIIPKLLSTERAILRLSWGESNTVFVSTSRGKQVHSHPGTISVPHVFAEAIELPDGINLEASIVSGIPRTPGMVYVTPETPDDWEKILANSSRVESVMLQQVEVITVGKVFPVRIAGNIICRLVAEGDGTLVRLDASSEVAVTPNERSKIRHGTGRLTPGVSGLAFISLDCFRVSSGDIVRLTGSGCKHVDWHSVKWGSPSNVAGGGEIVSRAIRKGEGISLGATERRALGLCIGCSVQVSKVVPGTACTAIRLRCVSGASTQGSLDALTSALCIFLEDIEIAYFDNGISESLDVPMIDGQLVELGSFGLYSISRGDGEDQGSVWFINSDAVKSNEIIVSLDGIPYNDYYGMVDPLDRIRPISDLGGVFDCSYALMSRIRNTISQSRNISGLEHLPHILLSGSSGSGKSSLIKSVSYALRDSSPYPSVQIVPCSDIISNKLEDIQHVIFSVIEQARQHSPSIVIFDALDKLLPCDLDTDPHHSLRTQKLAECLADQLSSLSLSIVCVATVFSRRSISKTLRIPGLFTHEFRIPTLDIAARIDIIRSQLQSRGFTLASKFTAFKKETEGCVAIDLVQLSERLIHTNVARTCSRQVTCEDMVASLQGFQPRCLKSLQLNESSALWSDIGGLDEVRSILKETFELPSKFSLLFENVPLKLRSGILLFGPPGCGKTILAKAVADECGLNFVSVKGPELLNKYIGQSEQSVRDIFERASGAAPCIVFFDEFESIAPRRGSDSTGVTDRVVNQMLCQLDGVESREGVYILAATSRPDLIDPALLRPGRLDKSLYCGLPDESARLAILEIAVSQVSTGDDVCLEDLARDTSNFTGADLVGLVASAQILAVHQAVDAPRIESKQLVILKHHFNEALLDTRLSVSDSERLRFEKIYSNFLGSRSGDFCLRYRQGHSQQRTALK